MDKFFCFQLIYFIIITSPCSSFPINYNHVSFSQKEYIFDNVILEQKNTLKLIIKNNIKQRIKVENIRTSCGCLHIVTKLEYLNPGDNFIQIEAYQNDISKTTNHHKIYVEYQDIDQKIRISFASITLKFKFTNGWHSSGQQVFFIGKKTSFNLFKPSKHEYIYVHDHIDDFDFIPIFNHDKIDLKIGTKKLSDNMKKLEITFSPTVHWTLGENRCAFSLQACNRITKYREISREIILLGEINDLDSCGQWTDIPRYGSFTLPLEINHLTGIITPEGRVRHTITQNDPKHLRIEFNTLYYNPEFIIVEYKDDDGLLLYKKLIREETPEDFSRLIAVQEDNILQINSYYEINQIRILYKDDTLNAQIIQNTKISITGNGYFRISIKTKDGKQLEQNYYKTENQITLLDEINQ